MRLTEEQVSSIVAALNPMLESRQVELRLYGSRADETKKGGDIDLVLVFENSREAEELASTKHAMLSNIKKHIGDQKIDLSLIDKIEFLENPFWQTVVSESVILHRWL